MSFKEFREETLKVKQTRNHKIKKSLNVYDAYKWVRKNKWLNIGLPISEHDFYYTIRTLNKLFVESFIAGDDIILPLELGRIELRKYSPTFKIVDGKVKTNLPIDWNETLKLWYEDEESKLNKVLVKKNSKELFKIVYNKHKAKYNNKTFIDFIPARTLKLKLKELIKNNNIDAFNF